MYSFFQSYPVTYCNRSSYVHAEYIGRLHTPREFYLSDWSCLPFYTEQNQRNQHNHVI